MRRRQLVVVTGSAFFGAGCIGTVDQSNNPTQTGVKEPSPTEGKTSSETDATASLDCTLADLAIFNDMSKEVTVSVRLVKGHGRYRYGSPTATEADSPTETTSVTFADEISIPADGKKVYDDLPEASGAHRFEVSVKNGPAATDYIQSGWWEGSESIMAVIRTNDIEFLHGTGDLPPGC